MTPFAIGLLCAAYIFGLLLTAFPGEVAGLPVGAIAALALGIIAAGVMPRLWQTRSKRWWLAAGLVACVAVFYFQVRTPQPIESDISRLTPDVVRMQVQGKIDSTPRLTRSQKIQFWLKPHHAIADSRIESVTGKLYVTVPLLQGTGLYPNQAVTVTGFLYDPKPAANPGGFNFQAYLKQEGGLAGLSGRSISLQPGTAPPLLWSVRQRILRSQVQALGVPAGPLVSAMVMGRNGVDLPFIVQDQFNRVGLAHALAASGFQVSLLIGIVIALTGRLPSQVRWSLGTGMVFAYVGLTGLQPAVLRAAIMGLAALYALTSDRKIRPLASLLVAATSLLLWNPLWIWNLGFQFSFMATLGLLLTAQPLTKRLDWLPTWIAATAAVSIAAYLWTLPLQLFVFGIVSPYSIAINILATPLIVVVSIGGMISALAALVSPTLSSLVTPLLFYPTQALLELVAWGDRLPGNTYAIGKASALQVTILYVLWAGLSWHNSRQQTRQQKQPRLWAIAAFSLSLVILPAWYAQAHLTRISVLATDMPVFVVQTPGQVVLINSGSEVDLRYTVEPFLRQAGINRIDRAIALDAQSNWEGLRQTHSIERLYQIEDPIQDSAADAQILRANQALTLDPLTIRLVSATPAVLEMQLADQHWLLVSQLNANRPQSFSSLPKAAVLWWPGQNLPDLFRLVQPNVAIAPTLHSSTAANLRRFDTATFSTAEQGAIEWTPQGFTATLEAAEDR